MSEFDDAVRLANEILERPSDDPDDDLAVLSRQFLWAVKRADLLRDDLRDLHDSASPQIQANRFELLLVAQEGLYRVRRALESGNLDLALRIIDVANRFHPGHAEDWKGWPEA